MPLSTCLVLNRYKRMAKKKLAEARARMGEEPAPRLSEAAGASPPGGNTVPALPRPARTAQSSTSSSEAGYEVDDKGRRQHAPLLYRV